MQPLGVCQQYIGQIFSGATMGHLVPEHACKTRVCIRCLRKCGLQAAHIGFSPVHSRLHGLYLAFEIGALLGCSDQFGCLAREIYSHN